MSHRTSGKPLAGTHAAPASLAGATNSGASGGAVIAAAIAALICIAMVGFVTIRRRRSASKHSSG